MSFDRALTQTLVLPAAMAASLFVITLALWTPRSFTTILAILGIAMCGAFSLSAMPQAIQLLMKEPQYRTGRNIACVLAGAVPAAVTICLLAAITWVIVTEFGQGDSVMFGGAGA